MIAGGGDLGGDTASPMKTAAEWMEDFSHEPPLSQLPEACLDEVLITGFITEDSPFCLTRAITMDHKP